MPYTHCCQSTPYSQSMQYNLKKIQGQSKYHMQPLKEQKDCIHCKIALIWVCHAHNKVVAVSAYIEAHE